MNVEIADRGCDVYCRSRTLCGQVRHTDAEAAAGTVAPVTADACLAMMIRPED